MTSLKSSSSSTSLSLAYQQTNQWLQDAAKNAGVGKMSWPPKPSIGNAAEIVSAFLSYQKITAGVLEHFMDSYLQFERTGRTFSTEHALTKVIMNDSASRAVPLPDRNMVAFVSASKRAVSSDAQFLRMTLDAMDSGVQGNYQSPDITSSIQKGKESHQSMSMSAKAGVGTSILSFFHMSADAAAEMRNDNQTIKQVSATGKTNIDAQDRQVLSCLSAIYAMEQSGVLPQGKFMDTLVLLSKISAKKTGEESIDLQSAQSMLADPEGTITPINDAMMMSAHIRKFMLSFCADHLYMAMDKDDDSKETDFWSKALRTFENGNIQGPEIDMLYRYVDNQDHPEPNMVVSMLQMWDVMSKTRKAASTFLLDKKTDAWYDIIDQQRPGMSVASLALSPVIGDGYALVVNMDNRGKLNAKIQPIDSVVTIFPTIKPFVDEDPGRMQGGLLVVKNDQWDAALKAVKQINKDLMGAVAHGQVSVIREDAEGHRCLVREKKPDTPTLDSMSPWD